MISGVQINPTLVLPSEEYKESFIEALAEQPEGEKSRLNGDKQGKYDGDFDAFLASLKDAREGKNLPEGYVPQTVYWIVDGNKFIGRVAIRHMLNDHLTILGGHIGYAIRPTERNKGYGSLALKLALPKARELGIEKALVTCAKGNLASKKIIEKNGGIFEDEGIADDGTRDQAQLHDLGLEEVNSPALEERVLDHAESDRHGLDQAGLDLLPG